MAISSSVDLRALPSVSFAPLSAADIEASILTTYEGLTGVSLQPGDPVRLFLEALAYVLSVQNLLLNLAGQQGLLAYAQGAHLDHLGALMGVARIPAQSARLSLRFVLGEPLGFAVPIPEGTRVATMDGQIAFATVSDSEIAAGELQVDVAALCTTSGAQATGLVPGQVTQLVDPIPYVVSVSNTTTSVEGADIEDDERLRERIRLAPETYTVAGSTGAYEARVLRRHRGRVRHLTGAGRGGRALCAGRWRAAGRGHDLDGARGPVRRDRAAPHRQGGCGRA